MTNYTNRFNLPPEITSILTRSRYNETNEDLGDYSATRLIAPIQQTTLISRHKNNLKVFDVIDQFWSFVGSISHKVLEEHACGNGLYEKRFYLDINGKKISGQVDHYHSGIITDYKSTKAYKIMRGDFSEWEQQLNIYAHLARANGLPVERLRIFAFILDWKQSENYQKNYPQCPIVEIPLTLKDHAEMESWLNSRVVDLTFASQICDDELADRYPCSDKEMWQDLKDYAIYHRNDQQRKRAKKVLKSDTEMLTYDLKYDEICVPRYSERKRCLSHCSASIHCQQHHALCIAENRPTETTELIF